MEKGLCFPFLFYRILFLIKFVLSLFLTGTYLSASPCTKAFCALRVPVFFILFTLLLRL